VCIGIARDAAHLAQRLAQRLADGDANILDGVVLVDMQIALGLRTVMSIRRMARQLIEHMVEEADAGGDIELAGAVEIQRYRDLGFLRLALDRGATHI
jgi:hypothetical protein